MNKYILPGSLALLGLAFLLKKPQQPPVDTGSPSLPDNPLPDIDTINEDQYQINAIRSIRGTSNSIDYKRWLRRDWAAYFQYLLSISDPQTAIDTLFDRWYDPQNKARNLFTNKTGFAMNLALYREPVAVGTGYNIQWNSTPVYGGIWAYWNGENFWDCEDWRTWHVKLEQHYNSTQKANEVWLSGWLDDQNWTQASSTTYWLLPSGVLPPSANCPTDGNCWFIEYFYSKGIDVATLLGGASCDLSNIVQNIVGTVENISSGAASVTKMLSVGVPVAIGVWAYFWYQKQKL